MEFKETIGSGSETPIFQFKQETVNEEYESNQWTKGYNINLCESDPEKNKLLVDVVKEEYVLTYPDVSDVIQHALSLDTYVDAEDTFVDVEGTFEDVEDDFVDVEGTSDDFSAENDNPSMVTNYKSNNTDDDDKDFECFCCRQTFRKEFQLRTHLKTCFRQFECNICRRRFKCRAYLMTHKRTHVTDYSIKPIDSDKIVEKSSDNSIVCREIGCNKTFTRKDRLVVHMRIHSGEKPYQCDEIGCCKKFTEWSNLEKHRRIHAGEKRFVCDEPGCDKKYSAKCNLMEHRRTHTGDKLDKVQKFICKICDKTFQPSSVRKHLQMHTGVKPHVCNQPGCGKKFMRKYRLIEHYRVHSNERPFLCAHCNTKFKHEVSLKKHVQKHGDA